jgi:HYDIN/CFA65/VesB-like, Ig-like domain/Abnormal spindle-like microcephaly-assoc'd, ASPM-SPD-2-Hydin
MGRLALMALVAFAGRAEAVQCAPAAIDFGNVVMGGMPKTATVTNNDIAPVAIVQIGISGAQKDWFALVQPPKLPIELAANGGMVALSVVAVPLGMGPGTASLDFGFSNGGCSIPLKVNDVGGSILVDPLFAAFGLSKLFVDSKPRTFTIFNQGPGLLNLYGVTFGDDTMGKDAPAFSSPKPVVPPVTLAAKQWVQFDVLFHPTDARDYTAWIEIASDDPMNQRLRMPLSGTGTALAVSIDPSAIDFGNAAVGVSTPRSFLIANTGLVGLLVTSITVEQGPFSVDQAGPLTIPKGKSQSVNVSFSPTVAGKSDGSIGVTMMGLPKAVVSLTGMAAVPELTVSPTAIGFGAVPTCESSAPRFVTLRNSGAVTLHIAWVRARDREFQTDLAGTRFALEPGGETGFNVTFDPLDDGDRTSAVDVTVDEIRAIHTVAVTATATPCGGRSSCASGAGRPISAWPLAALLLALLHSRKRWISPCKRRDCPCRVSSDRRS